MLGTILAHANWREYEILSRKRGFAQSHSPYPNQISETMLYIDIDSVCINYFHSMVLHG